MEMKMLSILGEQYLKAKKLIPTYATDEELNNFTDEYFAGPEANEAFGKAIGRVAVWCIHPLFLAIERRHFVNALFGCGKETAGKIFRNIPNNTVAKLIFEMADLTEEEHAIDEDEILASQNKIIAAINEMAEAGEITLSDD